MTRFFVPLRSRLSFWANLQYFFILVALMQGYKVFYYHEYETFLRDPNLKNSDNYYSSLYKDDELPKMRSFPMLAALGYPTPPVSAPVEWLTFHLMLSLIHITAMAMLPDSIPLLFCSYGSWAVVVLMKADHLSNLSTFASSIINWGAVLVSFLLLLIYVIIVDDKSRFPTPEHSDQGRRLIERLHWVKALYLFVFTAPALVEFLFFFSHPELIFVIYMNSLTYLCQKIALGTWLFYGAFAFYYLFRSLFSVLSGITDRED